MKKVESKKKTKNIISFLDENRKVIYGFIGGALVAAIVATIIWPDRIAQLKDGTEPVAEINGEVVTADTLYENMKEYYPISQLLDIIDNMILEPKYEENTEMLESIEKTAQNYYTQYEQYYGTTKEQFLKNNGFSSHKDFLNVLKLNYRRNEYFNEYVKSLITEKDIENYYNNEVYGDINSEHMLVTIDNNRTEEEAKKLGNEIIAKLNEGKSFEEVKEEYKDKITYENLNYQGFNSNIQESYMTALKNLKDGEYTKELVKTTYGYHIIHRIDQKDKASLEDVKDAVIDVLVNNKKAEDKNLYYKALDHLREENSLKFSDTVMESKYNEYLKEHK